MERRTHRRGKEELNLTFKILSASQREQQELAHQRHVFFCITICDPISVSEVKYKTFALMQKQNSHINAEAEFTHIHNVNIRLYNKKSRLRNVISQLDIKMF